MGSTKRWNWFGKALLEGMRKAMPLVNEIPEKCKLCGSRNIVRFGHYKQIQRWWCKDCGRKFVNNDALPKMKTPVIQIALAMSEFYEGNSLQAICRNLHQTYNSYVTDAAVYYWITKFTKIAIARIEGITPVVGDIWVADETVLDIGGENIWFWDIIDTKTRFLLASHTSLTRTKRVAQTLMEKAAERAQKTPKVVRTDKLAAYLDGIELAFGADTKHKQGGPFSTEANTNLIERFHGTLKARTKVMRGLKKSRTASLVMDGWLVHYNFLRPHESLKGLTPAEAAKVRFPYKNWLDIVRGG